MTDPTARLNTAWLFVKRNWPIIVPAVVVIVFLLAAVTATTTLTRCGCQGPVPTPTPGPTATHTPTPVWEPPETPTPQSGDVISDVGVMTWDALPTTGQSYYDLSWDGAHIVIIGCVGGYCPPGFPLEIEYILAITPTYTLWVDLEARSTAGVLASTRIETEMVGASEPGTGQHDGAQSWTWEPGLPTWTQFTLWRRLVWRGDGLPDLVSPVQMSGGVVLALDERGFAPVGEYVVP